MASPLQLPGRPWIVGHRGAAGEELENTLAGVARALGAGVDMIEVDLQEAAGGELVVFHDDTLERLAGDRRPVSRLRWSELSRVELRAPGRREAHRIPRLEDLLEAVPASMPLNLDVKIPAARAEAFAERLLDVLGRRPGVLVSCFDWRVLGALGRRAPTLPLAPISRSDRPGLLAAGAELDAWSLHCHHTLATRRLLDSPARGGRPVLAYTVNRPRRARELLRRGVAGLFTDHPTRLIESLARWPP